MAKIIKFEQPNCPQCRIVDGLMKHLNLVQDEKVDIVCDEGAMELIEKYNIKSTPTLILVDNEGNLIDRVSGANKDAIVELFAKRG